MFIIIPGRKKLKKEVINAIKNSELSNEALFGVYNFVQSEHKASMKNFKIGAIVVAVIIAVMSISTLYKAIVAGFFGYVTYLLLLYAAAALILIFIKAYYVDTMKRQFARAVRAGYPSFETFHNID